MERFIVTGAPGAGKTSILLALEERGERVVREAATDINELEIARGVVEPHRAAGFIEAILGLQIQRQRLADAVPAERVFYDRSALCTLALARFIGTPPSEPLLAEIERLRREGVFDRRVFFIEHLGFVTPTPARRIDLAGAKAFEAHHRGVYLEHGYDLIGVPRGGLDARVQTLLGVVNGGA
jgi:predicted ATPase